MAQKKLRKKYDLIVIGGGSAGMAAALSAKKNGVKKILIIERDIELGGVLNQCIHNGFGVHHFKEELTGPEYAARVIKELKETDIDVLLDTMVLRLDQKKKVYALSFEHGFLELKAKSIVLAMGCRERSRGAVNVYGSRPAGVFTAGTAQRLINVEGLLPGKEVVILGSGDIGLIMARRMVLEGAKVKMVLEVMPRSNGLPRNIAQCLEDFKIPLLLSHTVLEVHGKDRLEAVTIAKVDDKWQPVPGTEKTVSCDTLLLAVGLIPENEISKEVGVLLDPVTKGAIVGEMRQTSVEGVFSCGNVLQVHDIVDFVSVEGEVAGQGVARYLKGELNIDLTHRFIAGDGIGYVVPQKLCLANIEKDVTLYLRVKRATCSAEIQVACGEKIVARKRAIRFLPAEMINITIKAEELAKCEEKDLFVRIKS